jgi:hypothetical protein
MHHLSLYFDSKVYRLIFQTTAQIPEVEYGAKYGHMRANHFSCIINRLLYSGMYNMEIYCTRPYCIENLYWTRRLRRLVQYGSSIQYRLVQYISILYIPLYNNLLLLYSNNFHPIKNTHLRHVTVHYFSVLYNRKPYWTSR